MSGEKCDVCGFQIENCVYKCKKCGEIYCGDCALRELPPDDICIGCKHIEDYDNDEY